MNLIPVPRVFEPTKVRYELPKNFAFYLSPQFCTLREVLEQGFLAAGATPREGNESADVRIVCSADGNMGDEEYSLVIDDTGVCVTAANLRGAFYGIMTLFQAARVAFRPAGDIILQGCNISDSPRLDSRPLVVCKLPRIEYARTLLRYMAYNKLNELRFACHVPDEYKAAISDMAEQYFIRLIYDATLPAKTCDFSRPYIRFRLKKTYMGGYCGALLHVCDDAAEFQFFNLPRLQAVAESLWSEPSRLDYFDFECRLQQALQEMYIDGLYYCKPHLFRVSRRYSRCTMRRKLRAALATRGQSDRLAAIMSSELALNEYEDLL